MKSILSNPIHSTEEPSNKYDIYADSPLSLIQERGDKIIAYTEFRLMELSSTLRTLFSRYQPELLEQSERTILIAKLILGYLFDKSPDTHRKLVKDEKWVNEYLFYNLEGVRQVIRENNITSLISLDQYYEKARAAMLGEAENIISKRKEEEINRRKEEEIRILEQMDHSLKLLNGTPTTDYHKLNSFMFPIAANNVELLDKKSNSTTIALQNGEIITLH